MNTLSAVFILLGFVGAAAAFGIYGLSQPWWRTQIGRFLVSQAGIITVVYAESITRWLLHVKYPNWISPTTNGIVAVLMLWHAWVFAVITIRARRERREDQTIGETR